MPRQLTHITAESVEYRNYLLDRLNMYRICGLTPDDCFSWKGASQGGPNDYSYGVLSDKRQKRKKIAAHRLAYELEIGPLSQGQMVLHSCDNPPCTNPRHLRAGNGSQNMQDRRDRGRARVYAGVDHWTHQHPENIQRGDDHWLRRNPERVAERLGSKNPNSNLTESDVLEIRARWDGTFKSSQMLAEMFGIATQSVQLIVQRKKWKHLPPQPGDVPPRTERAWAKGESITNSILTADNVREIRRSWDNVIDKYRARAGFCRLMAERYGTQPVAIDKILRGVNWRHVE